MPFFYLALLFVLMEVNKTIAPASPPGPSTANNHTQKHHHLHSQIHSQSHHHGIFSSTSILILVISIIFIILLLAIILIIFLLRRLKSAKNNGNWKKHNSMHNTRSRFIAHTTVNVNSSPGDYLFFKVYKFNIFWRCWSFKAMLAYRKCIQVSIFMVSVNVLLSSPLFGPPLLSHFHKTNHFQPPKYTFTWFIHITLWLKMTLLDFCSFFFFYFLKKFLPFKFYSN